MRSSDSIRIVLDLDDTLYLERDYALSGIDAVGCWVERTLGVNGFAAQARSLFLDGRRGDLFDATLAQLGVSGSPDLVARLVFEYRRHRPAIALAADAEGFLERAAGRPMAVITDGFALAQRMKAAALGLGARYRLPVQYTDDWGRGFWKPHVRAFEAVARLLGGDAFVYVADNPAKDFVAPRALGWRTVQIARPERLHHRAAPSPRHRPDIVVASFDDVDDAVREVSPGRAARAG